MANKKVNEADLYKNSIEIIRIGNSAIQKAMEENRKKGLPNVFTKNGKVYYELPDGTITDKDPVGDE